MSAMTQKASFSQTHKSGDKVSLFDSLFYVHRTFLITIIAQLNDSQFGIVKYASFFGTSK